MDPTSGKIVYSKEKFRVEEHILSGQKIKSKGHYYGCNPLTEKEDYTRTQQINDPSPMTGLQEGVKEGMCLQLGDIVLISGQECGTIKFLGKTHFKPGIWAGIDLFTPVGLHNGTVDGVQYFSCQPKHGVFAPLWKLECIQSEDSEPVVNTKSKKR